MRLPKREQGLQAEYETANHVLEDSKVCLMRGRISEDGTPLGLGERFESSEVFEGFLCREAGYERLRTAYLQPIVFTAMFYGATHLKTHLHYLPMVLRSILMTWGASRKLLDRNLGLASQPHLSRGSSGPWVAGDMCARTSTSTSVLARPRGIIFLVYSLSSLFVLSSSQISASSLHNVQYTF